MPIYSPNEDPRAQEIEALNARVKVLQGLLRMWLEWKKMDNVKRTTLRKHTRKVLGIQSPRQNEVRREPFKEKKPAKQKKGRIITPGEDSP